MFVGERRRERDFDCRLSGLKLVTPSTLAKSEDLDEMSHIAVFRLGLNCLLNENYLSEK